MGVLLVGWLFGDRGGGFWNRISEFAEFQNFFGEMG
jgi:hypothetical protein